jgi:DNA-binding transcriptional MerR regulator
VEDSVDETVDQLRELMTLDELCNRVGLSVRNVRFYTTRGLVPPPIRRGRSGYYSPEHVVRLELVQELQAHGFTLAAIEKYVARIPADATPADIALQRSMLTPWMSEAPELITRSELDERAGRQLTGDELEALELMGIVKLAGRKFEVVRSYLSVGIGVLDTGYPMDAALAVQKVYADHGRAIAEELNQVFHTMVLPAYKEKGVSPEQIQEVVERLKPLSIAALVAAYEMAVDGMKRESIARRAR